MLHSNQHFVRYSSVATDHSQCTVLAWKIVTERTVSQHIVLLEVSAKPRTAAGAVCLHKADMLLGACVQALSARLDALEVED